MLMAVNVGNSRISIGFFAEDACQLLFKFKLATDLNKTSDEYLSLMRAIACERAVADQAITGGILSSVVPQLTGIVSEALERFTGVKPLLVGPGVKTGFPIKIDLPSELGGDMVANTAAVLAIQKQNGKEKTPAIIADLGTVTTISAVNRFGEYVGCCIFPGVQISFESLHGKTAQLPNVSFFAPEKTIGKNSQDSVRSGVIFGNAMMLDGFVWRFAKELKCKPDEATLVITGEYAKNVMDVCGHSFIYEEDLTLRGLVELYYNTIRCS